MKVFQIDVAFQEVPNHISLIFSITGCPYQCDGCHSSHLWDAENGIPLTPEKFIKVLHSYKSLITCICFFGGEWKREKLIELLKIAKEEGLETCLYTGGDNVHESILTHLTFIKTGPWKEHLGGLDNKHTNQKFIDLRNGESLNHLFRDKRGHTYVDIKSGSNKRQDQLHQ